MREQASAASQKSVELDELKERVPPAAPHAQKRVVGPAALQAAERGVTHTKAERDVEGTVKLKQADLSKVLR